jgi:HPt (histidine-containing phosphotransfer) domain-containing protein
MGGNETVCKEILKDMPEYLSGEIKKLKDWLKQKDIYMTTMQAHSIKGMAANIAAHRLRETAYKMELAGKAEDLEKADCFTAELEEEYKRLLSFLYECALLCEETDYVTKVQYVPKPMTADDISAIKPVMSRLNRFLEEGDTRAEDCMGELKECLAGFGFDEYLVRLEKHVFNYDFDEASDTLSAVRRKLSDTSR